MATAKPLIRPLPPQVAASIQSSATVTSLNDVIVSLIQNALDAGARKIDVSIDVRRGACTVEDDGLGIPPIEFRESGGLVRTHHTSKYPPSSERHGRHGIFLSSLAAFSLLSITSHHHLHQSHNTLVFHRSEVVSRLTPAPSHQHLICKMHGTRVSVNDLFGNMPVRLKQRDIAANDSVEISRDWDTVQRHIVALLLAWPSTVAVVVHDADSRRRCVIRDSPAPSYLLNSASQEDSASCAGLSRIKSLLCQTRYITPESWGSWLPVSASTHSLSIRGALSIEPSPSKSLQFISFGITPLTSAGGKSVFFGEINRIFSASSFGVVDDVPIVDMARSNANLTIKRSQSSYENKQLRGRRKGVNKWPMFYLDFRCSVDTSQEVFSRDHLHENNDFINAALDLLRVTLTHFLAEHHFLPSVGKGKVTSRAGAEASLGTTNGMLAPFEGVGRANPREHSATKGSSQSLSGTKDFTCQEEKIRAKVHNQSSQNAITDGNIKIPSFYSPTYTDRSRSRLHMNTLSKVKSSNPHWAYESWDPSPLKSKLPSTIVRPHHGQEEVAKERPRAVSCFSGANIPSVSAQLDDTQIVGGNIIRGINPFTRAPFSLNSKTGFVVPQLVRRPYSAPSILENLSAAPTSGRASKRLWALKAGTKAEDSDTPPSWVEKLLEDWDNPCFGPSSTPIRRLSFLDSCSDLKSALHPNAIPDGFMKLGQHRLNKDQLKYAKVLAQVDRKFILVRTSAPNPQIQSEVPRKDLLILIDQHAADERCRVESLLSNMFLFTNDELRQKTNQIIVRTTTLEPPLSFQVVAQEVNLFADHRQRLAKWGIQYEIGEALPEGTRARPSRDTVVKVVGLPTAIAERCKSEPSSLLEMMRSEIWAVDHKPRDDQSSTENIPLSEHSWLRHIISCPSGILDLLNSRACRSAIMFNDKLSLDDCQRLVSRLYNCVFPFQCAHGRPSMIPLLEMESIEQTWDYSQGYEHPTASLSLSSTASGEVGVRKGFIEAFSTWQQA